MARNSQAIQTLSRCHSGARVKRANYDVQLHIVESIVPHKWWRNGFRALRPTAHPGMTTLDRILHSSSDLPVVFVNGDVTFYSVPELALKLTKRNKIPHRIGA
jgi:hypothetical protein